MPADAPWVKVSIRPAAGILAVFLLLALPIRALALVSDTSLLLRSQTGDPLGHGQTLAFGPAQGSFTTSIDGRLGLRFRFSGSGHNWNLTAWRERWNFLVPDVYGPALGSSGDSLPRFTLSGDGLACTDYSFFDVRQLEYTGSTVTRLRLVFEHHCDSTSAALLGELRINSDTTLTVQAPLAVRARRGVPLVLPIGTLHALGLTATLSATGLPSGATFQDLGGGTGRLNWTPAADQQGDFHVTFAASDGQGRNEVAHTLLRVDGDTLIDVISEPGDLAWLGRSCRVRPASGTFYVNGPNVSVYSTDPTIGNRFFALNVTRPGNYSPLRRWSDESFTSGVFAMSPAPGSCSGVESHFRIRRARTGPTGTSQLWIEWEQHCDGDVPSCRGELRFNAGSPVTVYAPIARRVHFGDTLRIDVRGRDTLTRAITLSAWGLPIGAVWSSSGAIGTLTWVPTEAQAGPYSVMFAARNAAGQEDTVTTDVLVSGDFSARFVSERGDPMGAGAASDYSGKAGSWLTAAIEGSTDWGAIETVHLYQPGTHWKVRARGAYGTALAVGQLSFRDPGTTDAVLFARNETLGGGGAWEGNEYDIRVRQVERSGSSNPLKLWLEFEQRSGGRMPILSGEIRFNAFWRVMARAPLHRAAAWGQPIHFFVTGETPDGQVPVLTALDLPLQGWMTPAGPSRGEFSWVPQAIDVGTTHRVGFVATRPDGVADTAWTVLEALPRGSMHVERGPVALDLDSDHGQFRTYGSPRWPAVIFSSATADTNWMVEMTAGTGNPLEPGFYEMSYFAAYVCSHDLTQYWTDCTSDSGQFRVDWLARAADGRPTTLWGEYSHGNGDPAKHGSGWFQIGPTGEVAVIDAPAPVRFECSGFWPNPGREGSRLALTLPRTGDVTVSVFDLGGRRLLTRHWPALGAGPHVIEVEDLGDLPPGVHLARIEAAGERAVRRIVVLR